MTTTDTPYRIGLSTIQWYATADGHLDMNKGPSAKELAPYIREVGFMATPAKTPTGFSAAQMREILEAGKLQGMPAGVLVPGPEEPGSYADVLEETRAIAVKQAELGITEAFIIPAMCKLIPTRQERPAVGAAFDKGRLDEVTDRIGKMAEVLKSEGVKGALHSHVGTWIETEEEVRHVMKAISPDLLSLGPDTGHLSWAGVDVPAFFAEFADRIICMHLKDIRFDIRDRGFKEGKSYGETALMGLWAEPGLGNVDLQGAIYALGKDFNGWIVIEVDRPTMDPYESAKVSADWLAKLKRPH